MDKTKLLQHARNVREVGYTIIRQQLNRTAVEEIAKAFWPIYDQHLEEIRTNPNRGPMRHYIQLPFQSPFYQSSIHGDPDIIAVVRLLIGEDAEMVQYASDTPAMGSVTQEWHGDVPQLFPEEPEHVPPPAIITVNFPMVDVGEKNGPFEIADATHKIPKSEALKKIDTGECLLRRLLMNVGDVLIRDPRCVHRGTPNTTEVPRPVAVLAFERSWYHHISVRHPNPVQRDFFNTLSDLEQELLKRLVESE